MPKPKRRPAESLTLHQLELLNLVWERGEITVAEAHRALAKRRRVARTTVLTLLKRLEERGWLAHRRAGRTHWFHATRDRDESVGTILRRIRDTVFRGSTAGLVATLLQSEEIPPDELRRLRRLVADWEKGKS